MKKTFNFAANAAFVLLCIICVSFIFPVAFSIAVACLTPATLVDCTTSSPFWVVTVLSMLVTSIYFYEESCK